MIVAARLRKACVASRWQLVVQSPRLRVRRSLYRPLYPEVEFLDLAVEVEEMHTERCTHFVFSRGHFD